MVRTPFNLARGRGVFAAAGYALSVLMFTGAAALWARSYVGEDRFGFYSAHGHLLTVESYKSRCRFFYRGDLGVSGANRWGTHYQYRDDPQLYNGYTLALSPRWADPDWTTFQIGGYGVAWTRWHVVFVVVPWWGFVAVAVLLVYWRRRVWRCAAWRRERRIQMGLCPNCGYNLTGNTSGRCPECGGEPGRAMRRSAA